MNWELFFSAKVLYILMEVHFDGIEQFRLIFEDQIGDNCKNTTNFGLDYRFPSVDYYCFVPQHVPMIRKKMK